MTHERRQARDLRVDVVRGLALLAMYVAHCAPAAGPGGMLLLSEYLTYPLFAALVGAGAQLSHRRLTGPGRARTWWAIAVRGSMLIAVGLLLERAGAQVVIVLVHLGLLTWVAAPLARARTSVVVATGFAAYVVAPIAHDALLDARLQLIIDGHSTQVRLLDLLVTGGSYRLTSMLFFAAVGILLTRWLLHRGPAVQLKICVPTGILAGILVVASRADLLVLAPYDTTHVEHLFDALLLTATFLAGVAVTDLAARAVEPLAWMGQMAFTLYAAQIYWLAYYSGTLRPGEPDDSWVNVAILTVFSLAVAATWQRLVPSGTWRRGPLEGTTTLLATGLRRSPPDSPSLPDPERVPS